MKSLGHLLVEEFKLPAGNEWMDAAGAWRFARIHNGAAYWLGDPTRPLAEGETLVIPPKAKGVVRASQISDVVLHGFKFSPDLLGGIFSLVERDFFETRATNAQETVRFLPSTHPISQRFASVAAQCARNDSLAGRVEVLGVVVAVFETEMAQHRPHTASDTTALDRFKQLITRMPDTEIINHGPEQLARLCGCSSRHFNRLFQDHFGVSARARQTELRLLKARQLLSETNVKIINVALESGYRSLSLFNSMFKKRFGVTPSAWRRKQKSKSAPVRRMAAVIVALVSLACTSSSRAAETNATPVTATNAPVAAATNAPAATTTNAPVTFEVKAYDVINNTLLPYSVLEPILTKHVGPAVTFDTIKQALSETQMAYRQRGYVTVSVGLPQQQLTNGIVKMLVTEGRLTEVTISGNRFFSSNNIVRALPSLRSEGMFNGLAFQQELDRANANRDRQIYPVLSPGPEPGTSVLELKVKDRFPLHERVSLNNYAPPGTPDLRLGVSATYGNLWQLEHQAGVQYSFTPGEMKEDSEPFYDKPLIANYSAYYRMPLTPMNGEPREYAPADFGYDEVTHRFRPPAITAASELIVYAARSYSDTGKQLAARTLTPTVVPPTGGLQVSDTVFSRTLNPSENIGLRLTMPAPDIEKFRSTVSVGLDYKNYRNEIFQDRTFQATIFVPTVGETGPPFTEFQSPPTTSSRKLQNGVKYLPLSLGFDTMRKDAYGTTSFNMSHRFNMDGLFSGDHDFRLTAGTTNASDSFYAITAGMTREQKIVGEWSVRLHADGQWANGPLIGNEQFANGGVAGVRGYYDGQLYGDSGWRATIEPHTPYINVGLVDGTEPMYVRLYAFADYGQVFLTDEVTAHLNGSPDRENLFGVGAGADASIGDHFEARLVFGVPLLDVPGRNAGHVRTYFSIVAKF